VGRAADATRALREAASTAAEAASRARSVVDLLDEVLAELQCAEAAPGLAPVSSQPCPQEPNKLSAREREVLALVAAGQTNKAIASALYVSPNTVKTHVASLLHKLRADSRAELAAIATRQGLYQHAALSHGELTSRPIPAASRDTTTIGARVRLMSATEERPHQVMNCLIPSGPADEPGKSRK
jgi:DNA-binding CsgD family transcriptional regulator